MSVTIFTCSMTRLGEQNLKPRSQPRIVSGKRRHNHVAVEVSRSCVGCLLVKPDDRRAEVGGGEEL